MKRVERLGLGTAQFGMDYGISNSTGRVSDEDMVAILARCREAGINTIDTAALYGDAEARLGAMLQGNWVPRLVTKTLPLQKGLEEVENGILCSLQRLGRKSVYGILVHKAGDLLGEGGPALWSAVERLREMGHTTKIGVSIYNTHEVENLLRRYPIEIVQLPSSLLDQRLIRDGTIDRLKESGVEIHVRSVFLQGLLFLQGDDLPPELAFARKALAELHAHLDRAGVTPLRAALDYIAQRPEFDVVLIGVSTPDEIENILQAVASPPLALDWNRFALEDERILDPSQWQSL